MSAPMNDLEQRLSAALTASADQVQVEDLRPAHAPLPASAPPARRFSDWLRGLTPNGRRWGMVAAMVAVAAVIVATPFLVGSIREDSGPAPVDPATPATPTPAPDYETPKDVGTGWAVADRGKADLDGDGTPEQVILRFKSDLSIEQMRIESTLSSDGREVFGVLPSDSFPSVMAAFDPDADGGEELLIYHGVDSSDGSDLRAVDLVDDYLVDVPIEIGDAALAANSLETEPVDGQGRAFGVDRWVEEGVLYSARSVDSYPSEGPGSYFYLPQTFEAQVWAWRMENGRLVPRGQENRCLSFNEKSRTGNDTYLRAACPADFVDAVPDLTPAEDPWAAEGERVALNLDYLGKLDDVWVERESGGTVVRADTESGVRELSWAGDGEPRLLRYRVSGGEGDLPLAVVSQGPSADQDDWHVAVLNEDRQDYAEVIGDVPFGNGSEGDLSWRTWVVGDDETGVSLYTVVTEPGAAADSENTLYSWRLVAPKGANSGYGMEAVRIDNVCGDVAEPTSLARCS